MFQNISVTLKALKRNSFAKSPGIAAKKVKKMTTKKEQFTIK